MQSIQRAIHETAKEKGWWNRESNRNVGTLLALVHSELSEALEYWRNPEIQVGEVYYDADGKPYGFGIELADAMIRIFDMAEHLNLNMEQLIAIKMEYNKHRPHRHGGKRA